MSSYLWVIDLPYVARLHNGALLRYFNFSRELVAAGNTVTFAVVIEGDRKDAIEWLETLRKERVFTDFCELTVDAPSWNRLATILLPFGLHGLALQRFRASTARSIEALAKRYSTDVLVVSSVRFIYFAHEARLRPRIGDFCDSFTLYSWRDAKLVLGSGRLAEGARRLTSVLIWLFRELYVCRKYDANIFVSPVDKRVFDILGQSPEKNRLLPNGVRLNDELASVVKIPNQIIFSGAMNFPPNYDSAIWFLDHVFPTVLKSRPDTVLVIAGGRPHPELLSRAGPNVSVPGFVEDLNHAIAQSGLYVAPMRSGSGFKNKVAEALANGTWVIGTSLAVEFLDSPLREMITVRDDPQELAREICRFLENPTASAANLETARRVLAERFSWGAKARELDDIARSLRPRVGQDWTKAGEEPRP